MSRSCDIYAYCVCFSIAYLNSLIYQLYKLSSISSTVYIPNDDDNNNNNNNYYYYYYYYLSLTTPTDSPSLKFCDL